MDITRNSLRAALGAAVVALAACAGTPPPTAQMALANAARAHAAGAGGATLAPTEMGVARDKMMRANQAMAAKDYDTARTLAQQVQVDAQLAEARAESARAGQSATAMQEASRALSEEMARKKP